MSLQKRVVLVFVAVAAFGLAAWGVNWVMRARSQSAYADCTVYLRQIDSAKQWWALEHNKTTNDAVTWSNLVGPDKYLREIPTCPHGGAYSISRVGDGPTCSIQKDTDYFHGK